MGHYDVRKQMVMRIWRSRFVAQNRGLVKGRLQPEIFGPGDCKCHGSNQLNADPNAPIKFHSPGSKGLLQQPGGCDPLALGGLGWSRRTALKVMPP
jgi:hypothetical protein